MKIIFTLGDINGIGIEILFKSLSLFYTNFADKYKEINFSIAGNIKTIQDYIQLAGLDYLIINSRVSICGNDIDIIELPSASKIDFGTTTRDAGIVAAESFDFALKACLSGQYDAMVTMPICKEALYLAGWKFPWHTEALASGCKTKDPLMILFKDNIRCGLATIHTPIKNLAYELSFRTIVDLGTKFYDSLLKDFGIANPKIAVLGFNPHAGENGSIGDEERSIIEPAIEKLKARKINACGPFPADGFFAHGEYLNYDAYLAMYHDQGLIPLKLLSKGGGVNFTAGLPIVRTSPDHGTAFALAGKNVANPQSALDSIVAAIEIAQNRRSYCPIK